VTATIGELCAGYGGLGMGISAVLDAETAWVADVCKVDKDGNVGHHEPHRSPCTILEHRYPGVSNIGDITKVKWVPDCLVDLGGCGLPAEVLPDRSGWQCHRCRMLWPISLGKVYWPDVPAPVDILAGGTPCQDLSHAGKRAGMTEGTRSNLWVAMREAIAVLRPEARVWENVSGAYSAEADSDLGSDPRLLADTRRRDGQPVLRALGRVLGDLASLGYVGGWHGLRAADVGAPHGRLRVFVVAYPKGDTWWLQHLNGPAATDAAPHCCVPAADPIGRRRRRRSPFQIR
jgi:DNA (cytosine-5)-methyltransferase 1